MTDITVLDPESTMIGNAVKIIQTASDRAAEIPPLVIRAAAILAMQAGANPNPLSGELYIYPIMGKWTPYLGIAYYRRIAEEKGARVMFVAGGGQPRAMSAEEREAANIPEKTFASVASGFRGDRLIELLNHGIPWPDAVAMLTRTGIGILSDNEIRGRDGKHMNPPNGRSWQWKCDKRAEMDLYRKLGVVADSVMIAERQTMIAVQDIPDNVAEERERPFIIEGEIYDSEKLNRDMF